MVLSIKQRAGVAHALPHQKQGTGLPEHENVEQKLKNTEQSIPQVCMHTPNCRTYHLGRWCLSGVSWFAARPADNAMTAMQRTKCTAQLTFSSTTSSARGVRVDISRRKGRNLSCTSCSFNISEEAIS